MHLPKFKYYEPTTLGEACSLLLRKETRLIAGGTDLLVAMKQRVIRPRALVNIKSIPNLGSTFHFTLRFEKQMEKQKRPQADTIYQ